jgi:uncharacterized SAM-binding protein YcdF (DUF218 family)
MGVLLVGVILLWFSRRQTAGKIVTSIGVLLFGVLSYDAASEGLLRPLEYEHPPLKSMEGLSNVRWVAVLGGGHVSDPRLPATGQIGVSTLVRLAEGIRIHKMLPESKLILSGGASFDPVPNAEVMAEVALALGMVEDDLVLESTSRDTKDEARLIKEILGDAPFVLVTSASHMPRSVALFEELGMRPIPAPTGYRVKERQGARHPHGYFPSADGLQNAQTAVYEYLGLAWARLRGQI